MKWLILAVAGCLAASVCFGQVSKNYGSASGFGNVLYPGTGHAPITPPGWPYTPNYVARGSYGSAYRAGSNRTLVVPFPVYYGPLGYGPGYGSGYDQSGAAPPAGQDSAPPIINTNTAPSVVINQTFVPERAMPMVQDYGGPNGPPMPPDQPGGMRMYQGPPPATMPDPRSAARRDDQPTLYLIAFKDHTIVQALGYWVEDGNLHYVSAEHTLNQVSLDLLDRDLSQRLNDERSVEFKLPK